MLWSERAYEVGKPFALLLAIEALGGQFRNRLFREHGVSLLVPSKRISFNNEPLNFFTCWFCYRLDLPSQITFVEANW